MDFDHTKDVLFLSNMFKHAEMKGMSNEEYLI